MVDSPDGEREGWLTLRDASKKLGVSAATLRVWADEGRVTSYRTPGGHRRFRVGAPPFEHPKRATEMRWRLLENSALGRVQFASEQSEGTMNSLLARGEYRAWERQVIQLGVRFIESHESQAETRARALGEAYAKLNWRFGIALRDAMRGLSRLRAAFLESVVEFAFGIGEPNVDELNLWLRRANGIIDHLAEAVLESHEELERAKVGR